MSDRVYWRPLISEQGERLAGGWARFDRVERLTREDARVVPLSDAPVDVLDRLTAPRADCAGLDLSRPRLMGILNVTPDSFSDGGRFTKREWAVIHGEILIDHGADFIDVGGESTRPGAAEVLVEEENNRVIPAIEGLAGKGVPISVDTRKAAVAEAALAAGAAVINDVAAMTYDPRIAEIAATSGAPICLMHAQGDPETMQDDPSYRHVLLDVYDWLEDRIAVAEAAGIDRARIIVDPGIGFGKTIQHNLDLIAGISLFHGLGCPILLGASRKGFIGKLGQASDPEDRLPGSLTVFLAGLRQGVQIARVHDIFETKQAQRLHLSLG